MTLDAAGAATTTSISTATAAAPVLFTIAEIVVSQVRQQESAVCRAVIEDMEPGAAVCPAVKHIIDEIIWVMTFTRWSTDNGQGWGGHDEVPLTDVVCRHQSSSLACAFWDAWSGC